MDKVVVLHRKLGAPSGRIHDLSILELSPRLVQASLKMEVLDQTASYLYDFEVAWQEFQRLGVLSRFHIIRYCVY
jgi:hypothetical protein